MAEACPRSRSPASAPPAALCEPAFEPPRPAPLVEPSSVAGYLSEARRLARGELDLISIWPAWGFTGKLRGMQVLRRWVFVALAPEAVRRVLVTNAANYPKSDLMERALYELVGRGMFITNGDNWRWRRELAKPAFAGARVARMVGEVPPVAAALVERWRDVPEGARISLSDAMTAVTAEVVCRALFSVPLGLDRALELGNAFAAYQDGAAPFDLGFLLRLPPGLRPPPLRARAAARRIHRLLDGVLDQRRARGGDGDYIDLLLQGRDPARDTALSRAQIREEAAVMLLAGHETSASALTWAFYLASQAPTVEARLHAELEETLGSGAAARPPCYDDLPRLRYTAAIVQEALRLYPPVALLPREALADDEVRGRRVPAHSLVVVPTWLLHRHSAYWDEPHAFRPERFLEESPRGRAPFAYLPFGAGPRTCLGASFAMAEATLLLAALGQRFRFRLPAGAEVKPICRLTTRPAGGLEMELHHRH